MNYHNLDRLTTIKATLRKLRKKKTLLLGINKKIILYKIIRAPWHILLSMHAIELSHMHFCIDLMHSSLFRMRYKSWEMNSLPVSK